MERFGYYAERLPCSDSEKDACLGMVQSSIVCGASSGVMGCLAL